MTTDFGRDAGVPERTASRIDELLSSALEDQAREQQLMLEAVQSARGSLGAAQQEIASLRESIEGRDREVLTYLETHLKGLDAGRLAEISNSLSDIVGVIERWSKSIHGSITTTKSSLDETQKRISDGLMRSAQRTEALHTSLLEKMEGSFADSDRRSAEEGRKLLTPVIEALPQQVEVIKKALDDFSETNTESLQTASARTFDRIETLRGDLKKFQSAVDALPDSVGRQLRKDLEQAQSARAAMSRQISEASETLTEAVPKIESAVAKPIRMAQSSTDAKLAEVRDVLAGLPAGVGDSVYEVLDEFGDQVGSLAKRVRQLQLGVVESNARMEALQESLVSYLEERDQRQEETRDKILTDLIAELAQGLSRRDRKRVTDSLKEAEQRRRDARDAKRYRRAVSKGDMQATAPSQQDLQADDDPGSSKGAGDLPEPPIPEQEAVKPTETTQGTNDGAAVAKGEGDGGADVRPLDAAGSPSGDPADDASVEAEEVEPAKPEAPKSKSPKSKSQKSKSKKSRAKKSKSKKSADSRSGAARSKKSSSKPKG